MCIICPHTNSWCHVVYCLVSVIFIRHTFFVKLGNLSSSVAHLTCGLPQGSMLAPFLFSLYMLPLGSILRKHRVYFHFYADNTHIYLPIKRNDPSAFSTLLRCLDEVKIWLAQNI